MEIFLSFPIKKRLKLNSWSPSSYILYGSATDDNHFGVDILMEPDQLKAIVSTDGFVLQADIRKRQIPVDKWFLLEVSWVPSEIGVDEQLAIYINGVLRVSTQ